MISGHETGAMLLRQLREARGWSWSDLARALRDTARRLMVSSLTNRQVASIQRAVARWESLADRTSPGERYQFLLAHLYARGASGRLDLGPGSDFAKLMEALGHCGTAPDRIRQLTEAVTRSATGTGNPAKEDPLADLSFQVAEIDARIGSTPFVRLQLELVPIVEACRGLLDTDSAALRDDLVLLATRTYGLAARLAFETRDDETAMSLYLEAESVAGRLADRSHVAAVRTSHTMVTLHATNDLHAARELARRATADAHRGPSFAVRAHAHAVHAEICARAGLAGEAAEALHRAEKTVEQLAIDDPLGGFDAERLSGFEGLCALYAGAGARAHDCLLGSLASLRESRDSVQRGIVSTDLALARLQLGDAASCVDLLHDAVDMAANTGGRVAAQRVRRAWRDLRPWRAERFVADLDDHIHDVLIGR